MSKSNDQYVSCRAGIYCYTRRVPIDVGQYYAFPRPPLALGREEEASRRSIMGHQIALYSQQQPFYVPKILFSVGCLRLSLSLHNI